MKYSAKSFFSHQNGISLLEVLVVIVLTGLTSTMLLQATTFTLAAFEKNKGYQSRYQREILYLSWMRDSIENMMASHDAEFSMNGNASKIEGYSLAPIYKKSGELVHVTWFIERQSEKNKLWYKENNGKNALMASWQADDVHFSYVDMSGAEYSQWPAGDNKSGHIPAQVKLNIEDDLPEARRTIIMANRIRLQPVFDYRDFL